MGSIAVVIPCFNDAAMLRTCLAALAQQTRPADDIVVVDNGSTDDSRQVALEAGARVITEELRGIWPATATGFDAASGDVIARLDADSRPPADWLARVGSAFDSDPALDVLTGPGDFYGARPVLAKIASVVYIGGYFWAVGLWLGTTPVFGSNFAMRHRVWERTEPRVRRYLRAVHDDLDLSIHLDPDTRIRLDRTLRVGISARPFDNWRGLGRRVGWAYLTVRMNWPESSPWHRRRARLLRRPRW